MNYLLGFGSIQSHRHEFHGCRQIAKPHKYYLMCVIVFFGVCFLYLFCFSQVGILVKLPTPSTTITLLGYFELSKMLQVSLSLSLSLSLSHSLIKFWFSKSTTIIVKYVEKNTFRVILVHNKWVISFLQGQPPPQHLVSYQSLL